MSQVNVNSPPPGERPVETVDSASTDRTAAAGINLITVLIVLAVLVVIAWYLFTGPLRSFTGGGTTNVNINNPPQPAPTVNINPPNPSNSGGGPSAPNPGNPGNPGSGNNTSPGGGNTGTRP